MAIQPSPAARRLEILPGEVPASAVDHPAAIAPEDRSSPIELIPPELFLSGIFRFLGPEDLVQASLVCKAWAVVARDPVLWRGLGLNDHRGDWEGIDLAKYNIAPIPRAPIDMPIPIAAVCHLLSRTEEASAPPGSKVLLGIIPRGLTVNAVLKIAAHGDRALLRDPAGLEEAEDVPEDGGALMGGSAGPSEAEEVPEAAAEADREPRNKVPIAYVTDYIRDNYGPVSVEETCLVAMTGSVVRGSRTLTYDDQLRMLAEIGVSMSKLVDVAALATFAYRRSPEAQRVRLFPYAPMTYARCLKEGEGKYAPAFGGFALGGLDVYDCRHDFGFVSDGVAALRKFCGHWDLDT